MHDPREETLEARAARIAATKEAALREQFKDDEKAEGRVGVEMATWEHGKELDSPEGAPRGLRSCRCDPARKL